MSNKILVSEGWESRIRSKLGVLDSYLPDIDIQQPDCISVAEANILKQVPGYASLTDDDLVYLEAAVICECAVLLCPGMGARLPAKEQGPHESHQVSVDWDKKKTDFEKERDGYIGKISTVSVPSLNHFSISSPTREWEW